MVDDVRAQLEAAISAQERMRSTLGDAIVDTTIAALRSQLEAAISASADVEHERRLVTVLFMDVVDSTRILQGVDPEEAMTVMDPALQRLATPVRARGGRVTRFMGDGFLAVFGLQRTRENDAQMAVRAGLDILEAARMVAVDVAQSHDIAGFTVRVGINTGLVVTGGVTEAEDTVMGSAVNLASRIESAAPPGGLLISQSTYRQVRGRFELEPAGTIDAKGFDEPIPVHLVVGERSATTRAARGLEEIETDLIGRGPHLSSLGRALEDVASTGRARVVAVIGDAGVGKTRLVSEFETQLPQTSPVALFRARAALENSDIPYALLRDLVERCFAIRSDDPAPVVAEKLFAGLGAGLVDDADRPAKVVTVGRFLGYDMSSLASAGATPDSSEQLRNRSVTTLAEFFRDAAQPSAALILLDDLHWADEASLSVLDQLVEALADDSVLFITSSRPADRTGMEHFARREQLVVDPLSKEESEVLIDSILARVLDVPPRFRAMLLEHAGGNPYYLEELVMMCIDDGVIDAADDRWVIREEHLAALRLPATLTGVIQARLDSLSTSEHTTAQRASVVGRIFWDDVLAQLAGPGEPAEIRAALSSLQDRQMIHRREPSSFSKAEEYAFSHTLVRDATYESVLLGTRRDYHGVVADWLIERSGDREQELAGLIAGHLEKAARASEALEYLERAAEAALARHAVSAAADFYDRALALTATDDLERRYRLLLGRVKAWSFQGDRENQRRALDELEAIVEHLEDPVRRALVAIERTFLCFYTSDFAAALHSAERSVEFAVSAGDRALESRTESTLGWALTYLRRHDEAREHGRQALALARDAGAEAYEGTALNLLGMVAVAAGDLSEARERLTRALEIAGREDRSDAVATYQNNLAVALTMLGDYQGARRQFAEYLRVAEERGDRSGAATAHVNLAWVAASSGDWERARIHAERAISMKRRHEHREAEAEALLWLGHACLGLEALDEAEAAYEASLDIRRQLHQAALGLGARAGLARTALVRGDVAGAVGHAEAILEQLEAGEMLEGTWEPLRIHLAVIETLLAADDNRADHVLRDAAALLDERARMIPDPDDRRVFLEEVPWHRRIGELVGSLSE